MAGVLLVSMYTTSQQSAVSLKNKNITGQKSQARCVLQLNQYVFSNACNGIKIFCCSSSVKFEFPKKWIPFSLMKQIDVVYMLLNIPV